MKFPVDAEKYGQCYYKRLPKSTAVTKESPAHHHQEWDPKSNRRKRDTGEKKKEKTKVIEEPVEEEEEEEEQEVADSDLHALHPAGEIEREGLGQSFRDTPWVPPEYEDAMVYRRGLLYEQGKAPFCGSGLNQLATMGVGIGLYFMVVKHMIQVFCLATLLVTPHLAACYFGRGITPEEYGLLDFNRDGAGLGVGVGGSSFTAASHSRVWSGWGKGGYNASGMCLEVVIVAAKAAAAATPCRLRASRLRRSERSASLLGVASVVVGSTSSCSCGCASQAAFASAARRSAASSALSPSAWSDGPSRGCRMSKNRSECPARIESTASRAACERRRDGLSSS